MNISLRQYTRLQEILSDLEKFSNPHAANPKSELAFESNKAQNVIRRILAQDNFVAAKNVIGRYHEYPWHKFIHDVSQM